jgi:hypothetical protein
MISSIKSLPYPLPYSLSNHTPQLETPIRPRPRPLPTNDRKISHSPRISYTPTLTAAISSYITIHENYIYSIGGPTGEVHAAPDPNINSNSGSGSEVQDGTGDQDAGNVNGFGRKLQETVYVPEDMLGGWEKTNKALVSRKSTLSTSRTSDTDT